MGTGGSTGDVAVVFVHGIGAQRRSQTLVEWADPLMRRIELHCRARGWDLDVLSAELETDQTEVRARVTRPSGTSSIVLLEARWADAFLAPSSSMMLGWSVLFSGRAFLRLVRHLLRFTYAAGRATLADVKGAGWWRGAWRTLVAVARLAIVIPYTAFIILIAPITYVVALVLLILLEILGRIPVVSRWVQPLISALTTSIGDAAIWTTRPVSAAAIRSKVSARIERARQVADRVVVVGHSQGAAVAAEVIFNDGLSVDTFVSVGGAVLLLQRPGWSLAETPTFHPVEAWSKTDVEWIDIWALWDPVPAGPVADDRRDIRHRWRETFLPSVVEARYEKLHKATERRVQERVREARRATALEWIPLLAEPEGAPLVQGGDFPLPRMPIVYSGATVAGPAERPVYNASSLIRDHITYTANAVEVIDPLARITLGDDVYSERWLPDSAAATVKQHRTIVRMQAWLRVAALGAAFTLAPLFVPTATSGTWLTWLAEALGEGNVVGRVAAWVQEVGWERSLTFVAVVVGIYLVAWGVGAAMLSGAKHFNAWPRALDGDVRSTIGYVLCVAGSYLYLMGLFYLIGIRLFFIWLESSVDQFGYADPLQGLIALVLLAAFPMLAVLPLVGVWPAPIPARREAG